MIHSVPDLLHSVLECTPLEREKEKGKRERWIPLNVMDGVQSIHWEMEIHPVNRTHVAASSSTDRESLSHSAALLSSLSTAIYVNARVGGNH